MRPIKFRAWDEQNKVMHYDFQFFTSGDGGNDWICFSSDKEKRDTETCPSGILFKNPFFLQQFHIMQFTGLFDKNGREIYEWDIVNGGWDCEDGRLVVFEDGGFEPFSRSSGQEGEKPLWIEVIGNRLENPELLNPPSTPAEGELDG